MIKYVDKQSILQQLKSLKSNFQNQFTYTGNKAIGKAVYEDSTIETEYYEQNNTKIDIVGTKPGLYCLYVDGGCEATTFFSNLTYTDQYTGSYSLYEGDTLLSSNDATFDVYCWQRHYSGTLQDADQRGSNIIQAAGKQQDDSYQGDNYTNYAYDFITYIQMPVFIDQNKGNDQTDAVEAQINSETAENWQAVIDALSYSINPTVDQESGGGGGQYGGGSGYYSGGAGGGSGYIASPYLYKKCMYGYGVEESDTSTTKTISTDKVSEDAIAKYAKKGNGFARITFLGAPPE